MANYLFLIGINKYLKQNELYSCIKDCNDLKDILIEKYDFEKQYVYEVFDEQANNFNIQTAFKKYSSLLTEEDNLVIYYSGHGELDENEMGYWIPYDATDFTSHISNTSLLTYLGKINCKHIFVIADCCFSNSILTQGNFKKSQVYFEKPSRWALTSAFNEAHDADSETNTLFCEYILEYLNTATKEFRVSELIEHIKNKYYKNVVQTPQGGTLNINGHRGGEFVFFPKDGLDKRTFKGYNDLHKILKFFRPHSVFTQKELFEDRSNRIGYILYHEDDKLFKKATYYLYLFDGTNQSKTYEHLKTHFPEIVTKKNFVILITPDRTQKNREIRKKNINDKFRPINIHYLDEFIKEFCNPKLSSDNESEENSPYLNISNFVLPPFKTKEPTNDISQLFRNWFESIEEPIFIIKGSGGIGKTTLAQYLADDLLSTYNNLQVLFIDSVQIKDSLLRSRNADTLNIYNFYEAQYDVDENIENKLSEELFRINLDAGNILLIIDGLDEVISKIPNFDVTDFLNSIKNYSSELGNGKVIITCRTYFWNRSELANTVFKTIELEPFDEKLAQEFFSISFEKDSKKAQKALKMANSFKYPLESNDDPNIYHPYVLDIVRTLIQNESEEYSLSETVSDSIYLNTKISTDYIIYRVCDREQIRVNQLDVDKQIKFFIDFSVIHKGNLNINNLHSAIENSLGVKVSITNTEAFKSHPFLKIIGTTIYFRYDFLTDIFKVIYISKRFTYDSLDLDVTSEFIEIIKENCWFGSAFNNDITNRQEKWTTDELLLINEIILKINTNIKDISIKRKVIANIFNICLTINQNNYGNNAEKNTELLVSLFGNSLGIINGLCIIDLNPEKTIRFNLEDITIENSYIDNYGSFEKCAFNQNTLFNNCIILNTKVTPGRGVTMISKEIFINCSFDSIFDSSITSLEEKKEEASKSINSFLQSFFKLFYSGGRLGRQWEDQIIIPRFGAINKINIEYNRFISILKKNDILLVTKELNRNKFDIQQQAKNSIIKFVKDGTVDIILLKLISDLT